MKIIHDIRRELKAGADEATRRSAERFFKEKIMVYGWKTATVEKLAKTAFKTVKDQTKDEIFAWCEELWRSGYMEETFIACTWAYAVRRQFVPADFAVFERWVNDYVTNWAACDTLCNHTIGDFLQMYPHYLGELKRWAASPNRWMRRAAAVSLIVPAKKGLFLTEIFGLADLLLTDHDDLVQKGYGWMLKAASQAHQAEVFRYVVAHKAAMPRTALRYAIEKMPQELKAEAMKK